MSTPLPDTPPTALPPPEPLGFEAAGAWCFGWFHSPREPARDLAVVICRPFGYEAMCSYATLAALARSLCEAGLCVLRFDYQGTGDSAGDDQEPGRAQAWLDSVTAAVALARERSGAREVALVGVRLGATLAAITGARLGGVDSLVAWGACPTGRAFTRELRAAGLPEADGGLRALGYPYTAGTLDGIAALDATRPGAMPARRALVISRDDLPAEGPLPAAWRALGTEVEHAVLPGYTAMMRDPSEGLFEPQGLDAITRWLLASPAVACLRQGALPQPPAAGRIAGDVREAPLRVGAGLFGVLAEPAHPRPGRAAQTAVLLLNVGGNYRVGPHRIYVTAARAMAAQGYRVLRLDLAGIGDSPAAPGMPQANLYSKDSTRDVRAAIDTLWAQGCREFVLLGICSGSYVAFQTALVEPRVGMQVLLNSRLLEWQPGNPGDTWQTSMQRYVKSTDFYLQSLLRPDVWWKLLRGRVNVRPIAGRFADIAAARARRAFAAVTGRRAEESLLAKMKQACAAGTATLMLVSDQDDGRDYVEFHFGREGGRLRRHDNFRMVIVPRADHTFSDAASQRFVIDTVLRHLDSRPAKPPLTDAPAQEMAARSGVLQNG